MKNFFYMIILLLAGLNVIIGQRFILKTGRTGCNPACKNGGSCFRVKIGTSKIPNFKCHCLLGLYGVDCSKRVNFCQTLDDGITRISNPCSTHSLLTSCAPTETLVTIPDPNKDLNPTGTIQITLAGYACFQADQIATCTVVPANNPSFKFSYTCLTRDNPFYVY